MMLETLLANFGDHGSLRRRAPSTRVEEPTLSIVATRRRLDSRAPSTFEFINFRDKRKDFGCDPDGRRI